MINGVTSLFMTKADVLTGFEKINVCTAYRIDGEITNELPYDLNEDAEPVFIEMDGWMEDISMIRKYEDLPIALKEYVEFIEKEIALPVEIVSVGPDREETVFRSTP